METQKQVKTHPVLKSIILHLVPGIVVGAFYFLVRIPLDRAGFPSTFALMITIPLVLVPLELGYLLYQGKRETGRYTLKGVISYLKPIPTWQYFLWSIVVFGIVGLIFTLLRPIDSFLQDNLFFWIPKLESGLDGNFSKNNLIITYSVMLLFGVFVGPIVEELYFRGYLLPRTPGRLSILWHSLLFAAYHVFTPWMIITRTIGLLPLIFAVKKKNLYIGIIVHILVNSIDLVTGFAFIVAMS